MKPAILTPALLAPFVNRASYNTIAAIRDIHDVANSTSTSLPLSKNTMPDLGWQGREPHPASNELWSKSQCKGAAFNRAFTSTDAQAGALWTPARASAHSTWQYRTPE